MISRREVVTAGVLGGLVTAGPAAAAEAQVDEVMALKQGFKALEEGFTELKNTLERGLLGNTMNFGGVGIVKGRIADYARTSGRFPEYCDVGLNIFYDVYDWHVRHQQQINIARIADQRLAIQFMFTQLLVRWENDPNYVGTPYAAL